MQIEFKGMEELIGRLDSLGDRVSKDAQGRVLRRAGRVMRDAMRNAAPFLDKETQNSNALPPGALRDGIRVAAARDTDVPTVLVGPNGKTAHVARFVEFGHRNVKGGYSKMTGKGLETRGPGKQIGETPAHPFLRPAYEASLAEVEVAIREGYAEELAEATK